MTEIKLNLVVIRVAEMDKAAEFYVQLGVEFTKHRHGSGPEHYSAELGDVVFEIYPRSAEDMGGAETRLGFQVASVEAVVSRMEIAGAQIVSPPKDSPWGRRAVIADLDGHRIELTEQAT